MARARDDKVEPAAARFNTAGTSLPNRGNQKALETSTKAALSGTQEDKFGASRWTSGQSLGDVHRMQWTTTTCVLSGACSAALPLPRVNPCGYVAPTRVSLSQHPKPCRMLAHSPVAHAGSCAALPVPRVRAWGYAAPTCVGSPPLACPVSRSKGARASNDPEILNLRRLEDVHVLRPQRPEIAKLQGVLAHELQRPKRCRSLAPPIRGPAHDRDIMDKRSPSRLALTGMQDPSVVDLLLRCHYQ
ncbi:hypothetical protein CERSUDRAFT_77441 [Gelatoporia subvermispora B]|uniref:Uncharacterized protein n=1 Tax=Ceriporiopsis subvermispora (strain B) TaxID=914234 RepID=M2PAC5_CERS8|nr:hypothetical protein CERSUDRAFT_77441 [Gelatoporia subvermispora B]